MVGGGLLELHEFELHAGGRFAALVWRKDIACGQGGNDAVRGDWRHADELAADGCQRIGDDWLLVESERGI